MASSPKIDYAYPKNYIVKFSWSNAASYLILAYNVDNKFQFVDLRSGRIMNLVFDTVDDAERWLDSISQILERDTICTTYVP